MAKKPEAEPAAAAEAPAAAPKSRKKLIVITATAVVLAGGAAGGWLMTGARHGDGEAQARVEEARKKAGDSGPPVFLPLESFVVNLQPQTSSQFLQVDITLRVADAQVVGAIKTLMPEVRDRVLGLLGTRNAQDLTAPGGREKLAEAVRIEITRVVDPDAVREPAAPKPAKLAKEPAGGEEAAPEEPGVETEAEATEEEAPAEAPKIRSVLFTSFIIQ